ncbi:MAG: thiamine-phosphate kinase [Planctomycetota bacterium]
MELDFLDWLRDRLPTPAGVLLGVGDDAAVLGDSAAERTVATADLLVDGVHFLTAEHAPERIGRKALAVNLSDLAAMAAEPTGCLVSLAIPRGGAGGVGPGELARRLIEGMAPLAEEFGCPIVGGDTNATDGPLVVAVTALGRPNPRGLVRRDGARPGDWLMVTGEGLGGSLAGKHLDFTPRVAESLRLVERVDVHALMDLSDGLATDLPRLCAASGVGAVVFREHVIVSEAAERAATPGRSAFDRALGDGEDFELLFAVTPEAGRELLARAPFAVGTSWVGEVESGDRVEVQAADGSRAPLPTGGYEHR